MEELLSLSLSVARSRPYRFQYEVKFGRAKSTYPISKLKTIRLSRQGFITYDKYLNTFVLSRVVR